MHEIVEEDLGEPTKKKEEEAREKKTGTAQQRTKALIRFGASVQRKDLPPQLRERGV
jgi:hypothetical protein